MIGKVVLYANPESQHDKSTATLQLVTAETAFSNVH